jgi:phosphosulfolactate synthase (CoM biosynthesis protein A)
MAKYLVLHLGVQAINLVRDALGIEHLMFEAADPAVFEWYVKNYGAEVNLFVDHSQIVQLECLRSGVWGTKSTWGRIASYRESPQMRSPAPG